MKNDKIYILNFAWERTNYGAILTAFALQELIRLYSNNECLIVDNIDKRNKKTTEKFTFGETFKQKYMHFSEHINDYTKTKRLNDDGEIFITGSDQVFRIAYNKLQSLQYFLDFVNINKKKIAYSASFGVDKDKFLKENSPKQIERIKNSLKTFDFVSVREKSGLEICKDILEIDAQLIIDPVFILNKAKYEEFIDVSQDKYKGKIVSYILNKQEKYDESFKYLGKKYDSELVDTSFKNLSISEWLTSIKDCEFVITDSFHAICFAIIFNKPFICVTNPETGNARYKSLFEILGIKYDCITDVREILKKDCLFNGDYEEINKKIEIQREIGIEFLQKALTATPEITIEKLNARINLLEARLEEVFEETSIKNVLKRELWNKWLIIYHCYLPKPFSKIIRNFWIKGKNIARNDKFFSTKIRLEN